MTHKIIDHLAPNPEHTGAPVNLDDMLDLIESKARENPQFRAEYLSGELVRDVGDAIRQLRKRSHLTQKELAERVNDPQSFIAKLEKPHGHRQPTLQTLLKVSMALGYRLVIDFEEALPGKDEPVVSIDHVPACDLDEVEDKLTRAIADTHDVF